MIYIGQTGRNFLQQKKQHFRNYFYQYGKSNYAEHLIDKGHIFNKDYKVLLGINNSPLLNLNFSKKLVQNQF